MAAPGYPAYDPLFMALAQAKAQPSHAFRTAMSALDIPGEALQGYSQGLRLRNQIQQPEALRELYSAEGGPGAENLPASAFYGMTPKDVLEYAGTANRLRSQRELGLASINERDTASERAAEEAAARTAAIQSMGGARDLTSNIALHENAVKSLMDENSRLSSQVPGGMGGTIQNLLSKGGDITAYLRDPKFASIAAQMKGNQSQIGYHQAMLQPLYKAQGMQPSMMSDFGDNSDLNEINPPAPGGDQAVGSQLPGLSF
jgi:hypothetical protein